RRAASTESPPPLWGFWRPICAGKHDRKQPPRRDDRPRSDRMFHVKHPQGEVAATRQRAVGQWPTDPYPRCLNVWPGIRDASMLDGMSAPLQSHSPCSATEKAAALALIPIPPQTEARLDAYVDLLVQWQTKTNLV